MTNVSFYHFREKVDLRDLWEVDTLQCSPEDAYAYTHRGKAIPVLRVREMVFTERLHEVAYDGQTL